MPQQPESDIFNTRLALSQVSAGDFQPLHFDRAGHLRLGDWSLMDLATEFGTPVVVYSLERVRQNATRIRAAFTNALQERVRMAFAIKCCYLKPIIRSMIEMNWDVEVMSAFELELTRELGISGERIILTGLGWSEMLCRSALTAGVNRFVVDSDADAVMLSNTAKSVACTASILVRVNLEEEIGGTFLPRFGKLGCAPSSLLQWLTRVTSLPNLQLRGIHIHQMNRLHDPLIYRQIIEAFARVIDSVKANGFDFDEVDLGGGFESLARLDSRNSSIESFAEIAAQALDVQSLNFVRSEIGRAVVADAAVAVGTVTAIKQTAETKWVIVDVPMNTLIPIAGATYVPLPLKTLAAEPVSLYSFSDGTGSPLPFCERMPFPDCRLNDRVCFLDAGAYTTVFNELWAQELPTILIIDGPNLIYRDGRQTSAATKEVWLNDAAWKKRQVYL